MLAQVATSAALAHEDNNKAPDVCPRCQKALRATLRCVGQGHAKQLRFHDATVAASSPVHNIETEPHKIAQCLMQHRLHHQHKDSQSPMRKVHKATLRSVTIITDIACSADLPYTSPAYMPYWPQMHLPCWPLPYWHAMHMPC